MECVDGVGAARRFLTSWVPCPLAYMLGNKTRKAASSIWGVRSSFLLISSFTLAVFALFQCSYDSLARNSQIMKVVSGLFIKQVRLGLNIRLVHLLSPFPRTDLLQRDRHRLLPVMQNLHDVLCYSQWENPRLCRGGSSSLTF